MLILGSGIMSFVFCLCETLACSWNQAGGVRQHQEKQKHIEHVEGYLLKAANTRDGSHFPWFSLDLWAQLYCHDRSLGAEASVADSWSAARHAAKVTLTPTPRVGMRRGFTGERKLRRQRSAALPFQTKVAEEKIGWGIKNGQIKWDSRYVAAPCNYAVGSKFQLA